MKKKSGKIKEIRDIIMADANIYRIRIFIQADPADKKVFHESIDATGKLDIIALDLADAKVISDFLIAL